MFWHFCKPKQQKIKKLLFSINAKASVQKQSSKLSKNNKCLALMNHKTTLKRYIQENPHQQAIKQKEIKMAPPVHVEATDEWINANECRRCTTELHPSQYDVHWSEWGRAQQRRAIHESPAPGSLAVLREQQQLWRTWCCCAGYGGLFSFMTHDVVPSLRRLLPSSLVLSLPPPPPYFTCLVLLAPFWRRWQTFSTPLNYSRLSPAIPQPFFGLSNHGWVADTLLPMDWCSMSRFLFWIVWRDPCHDYSVRRILACPLITCLGGLGGVEAWGEIGRWVRRVFGDGIVAGGAVVEVPGTFPAASCLKVGFSVGFDCG